VKTSYLTAGISMGNLIRLFHRNKITLKPKYIGRTIFLIQSAIWSSIFATAEKALLKKKIEATPVPEDPVFIIGHWRTGSTLLHQIMNLDTENAAPTLFQVAVPDSFIISYPFYKPVLNATINKHRPMDKVKLGMNEPQEDEYAIYRITDFSPLEKLVFPKSLEYFLLNEDMFVPEEGRDLEEWENKLKSFFQKLYFKTGRTIVSKNPFNSFRIPTLAKIFPSARFIHIVRNPIDVVPSTINMWNIVQRQNSLINKEYKPTLREIVAVYNKMADRIDKDLCLIPTGKKAVVKYEDLIHDPISEVKKIYISLFKPFTVIFEEKLKNFLHEIENYEKNSFVISKEDKFYIINMMGDYMEKYGYK